MGKNNETTKPQNENEQNKTLAQRISEKLAQINETIENEKITKCVYYEKISTNNKYLYFTKQARNELTSAGLNIDTVTKYNYIKYSDAPNTYNNILNIFQTNADIFKKRAEK